jgi:hypothetical protein
MLIVVGAGIAGSWLTRVARAANVETVLIGDRPPSSLAAIGLLRPSHLAEADRPLLAPSINAWREAGCFVHQGAYVTRWDREDGKGQADWWAVDPRRSCSVPDVAGFAEPVSATSVRVGSEVFTGTVVWCDGGGEGRRTYGVTWYHPSPKAVRQPFVVHHMAPYKVLAATAFPTGARLGSSSATSAEVALEQAEKMFDVAAARGLLTTEEGWQMLSGTRLKRDHPLGQDGPAGAWHWSGFHRTGFGTVPADAARVLQEVKA